MTDNMTGESHLTGRSAWRPGPPDPGVACPACGRSGFPALRPAADGIVLAATIPQPIAAALRLTHLLSERERTVFQLLGLGHDNRSIARELSISERTVKRHMTVVLAKLKLESRLQAGLAALIISSSWPHGTAWPEGRMDHARMPDHTG